MQAVRECDEQAVRERAYYKWLEAGRPDGEDERFWFEAENSVRCERYLQAFRYPSIPIKTRPDDHPEISQERKEVIIRKAVTWCKDRMNNLVLGPKR